MVMLVKEISSQNGDTFAKITQGCRDRVKSYLIEKNIFQSSVETPRRVIYTQEVKAVRDKDSF